MKSFAIVIICFKRLDGIKRLLGSLERVDYCGRQDINLIFSIDYSGNTDVEDFANDYQWKYGHKTVRAFKENLGLKRHVLMCGDLTEQYDIVAVLEDDTFVSNSFYSYANQAAEFYYEDERIGGIALYSYQKNWQKWLLRFEPQKSEADAYFMKIAQSWGQVWTRPQWSSFKTWYNNNLVFDKSDDIPSNLRSWPESSWLKFYCLYLIRTNRFFLYPYYGLSTNFSDPGEHVIIQLTDYQVELVDNKREWRFEALNFDKSIIYDEYMERCGLGKYLGVDEDELTVDLYGTRNRKYYKRFVLSMESLKYKIVKSFDLSLRPIEMSVINDLPGNDIFLYDTQEYGSHGKTHFDERLLIYSIRSSDFNSIFRLLFSSKLRSKVNGLLKGEHG